MRRPASIASVAHTYRVAYYTEAPHSHLERCAKLSHSFQDRFVLVLLALLVEITDTKWLNTLFKAATRVERLSRLPVRHVLVPGPEFELDRR